MARDPTFCDDGEPDRRGHSDGSKATQFAPNDGRRRPGRPKGAKSLRTIYRAAGEAKIAVTMAGKTRRLTKTEAIVLKQADLALKGEQRAAERFLDKIEQYSPIDVQPDLTAALMREDLAILEAAAKRRLIGTPENREPGSTDMAGPAGAPEEGDG